MWSIFTTVMHWLRMLMTWIQEAESAIQQAQWVVRWLLKTGETITVWFDTQAEANAFLAGPAYRS